MLYEVITREIDELFNERGREVIARGIEHASSPGKPRLVIDVNAGQRDRARLFCVV